jgi:hypothetical protein
MHVWRKVVEGRYGSNQWGRRQKQETLGTLPRAPNEYGNEISPSVSFSPRLPRDLCYSSYTVLYICTSNACQWPSAGPSHLAIVIILFYTHQNIFLRVSIKKL